MVGDRNEGNSTMIKSLLIVTAVLFFVGTSTRFDSQRVRKYSFLFGAALFVYVVVRMALLPVAT